MGDLFNSGVQGQSGVSGQLVILAALSLMLVLSIVAGLYYLYATSSRGRLEDLVARHDRFGRGGSWLVRISLLILVAAAAVGGNWYLDRTSSCMSCHGEANYDESLSESVHASLECADCHDRLGVTGVPRQTVEYVRWVVSYSLEDGVPDLRAGSVEARNCLRCHEEVRSETLERGGIRVRHSDFLDEGYSCRDCHNSIGHGENVLEPSQPSMSKCLPCHDGERASAECTMCHAEDVSSKSLAERDRMVTVRLDANSANCYACHEQKRCTNCHGSVMPHPDGWGPGDTWTANGGTPGSHVREGFANRDSCYRCHFGEKQFEPPAGGCGPSCHKQPFNLHGGRAWVQEHGLEATGQKPGYFADCFMCHRSNLCEDCHDASYTQRFNPSAAGEEDYPREGDFDPQSYDY